MVRLVLNLLQQFERPSGSPTRVSASRGCLVRTRFGIIALLNRLFRYRHFSSYQALLEQSSALEYLWKIMVFPGRRSDRKDPLNENWKIAAITVKPLTFRFSMKRCLLNKLEL